ncbi:MAG: hypothetical protein P8X50_07560 [Maritimibacter sp.]
MVAFALPALASAQNVISCDFTSRCDRESQTCSEVSEAATYNADDASFRFLGHTAQVEQTGRDQGDLTITASYDGGDFVGVLALNAPAGMSNLRGAPPKGEPAMHYYFGTCLETKE